MKYLLIALLTVFVALAGVGFMHMYKQQLQVTTACEPTTLYTFDGTGRRSMVWNCADVDLLGAEETPPL